MLIDGLAATEAVDTSGETLDVEGCDISDYKNGTAVLNYEHQGSGDNKNDTASDLVGKVVFAKKIFGLEDCETERQRMFWRKVELPMVYVICRLFDAAGHQAAQALAAQIRDQTANGEKLICRFSIEGSTISKQGNCLKRSVARRLAATTKPANRSCDTGLLYDPQAPSGFEEMPEGSAAAEALKDINLATGDDDSFLTRKFEDPQYTKLGSWEGETQSLSKQDDLQEALQSIKSLKKALEAGSYNAAPGGLSGGAALQVEDQSLHRRAQANQLKAAYRDWDKSEDLGKYLRKKLPEMSDAFITKFVELANDYTARKTLLKSKEGFVDLMKGVASRLWPVAPREDVASPALQEDWQMGGNQEAREELGAGGMTTNDKARALHRLHGVTQVRLGQDGQRQFLLHRGMSLDEYQNSVEGEKTGHGVVQGRNWSSWTPHLEVARMFGADSNSDVPVVSAWIPEDKIDFVPNQLSTGSSGDPVATHVHDEHEVIVGPHESDLHELVSQAEAIRRKSVAPQGAHARINEAERVRSLLAAHIADPKVQQQKNQEVLKQRLRNAHPLPAGTQPSETRDPLEKKAAAKEDVDEHATSGDTSFDPAALEAQAPEAKKPRPATRWLWPKALKDKHKKVRGSQPIPRKLEQSYFDEGTGTLHTHLGSFPLNIPKDPYYESILRGPEVQPHHDEAMRHWLNVHNLLKAGQLPAPVAMHAALFSAMSPNTAVPRQEFAYSHLMDLMNRGMHPDKPGSVQSSHRKDFQERVAGEPPKLPEHGRDYWQGEGAKGITAASGNLIRDFSPGQKFETVGKYWRLHPQLVDLVRQYKDDGLAVANILGDQKLQAQRFNAAKATKTGERRPFYESTGKSEVPGFATKTIRYMLGMLGAGNIAVPDRHFVRHAFGLPQDEEVQDTVRQELGREPRSNDAYEEKIASPAGHLQGLLQGHPHSHALMQQIERYYAQHHPAVRYAQERFFNGKPDPQALFPGFWAHWLSIAPHERALGVRNDASNGGTDHRVYWDSVNKILREHNLPSTEIRKGEPLPRSYYEDAPLPVRTAAAHSAMAKAFGPEPAMWFYLKHLLPLLLAQHTRRQEKPQAQTVEEALQKLESLTLDLGLELADLRKKEQEKGATHANEFRGRAISPGQLIDRGGRKFELVHAGPQGYLARHPDKPGVFLNFDRKDQNTNYAVQKEPRYLDTNATVDAGKHGLASHNTAPAQQQLIHGLDLNAKEAPEPSHFDPGNSSYNHTSRWLKGPRGLMFVKDEYGLRHRDPDMHAPETTFHNLGRDFFGLGSYFANTAAFRDPRAGDGSISEAVQAIPGAEHFENNPAQHHALGQLLNSGELDKMLIMDNVLGNTDRRDVNMLFQRQPGNNVRQMKLIDHGHSFRYDSPFWRKDFLEQAMPAYLELADGNAPDEPMSPAAAKWLQGLDESKLDAQMKAHLVPDRYIVEATRRLRMLRDAALKNPGLTRSQLWATPFVGAKDKTNAA